MPDELKPGLQLPARRLGYIVVPLLAFMDGSAEAAGRLRSMATFLLFAAFAVAALICAWKIVARLDSPSFRRVVLGYALSVMLGVGAIGAFKILRGDPVLEQGFACASYEFLVTGRGPSGTGPAPAVPAPAGAGAVPGPGQAQQSGTVANAPASTARRVAPDQLDAFCQQQRAKGGKRLTFLPAAARDALGLPQHLRVEDAFLHVRILFLISALLLIAAMPAVVWAAIACLAVGREGEEAVCPAAWRLQTDSLTRLLYITAGFMIAGLLYSRARYAWPAHSLLPADARSYAAHVGSLVLYLGVANSVLIASYYLPVAAALARAGGASAPGPRDSVERTSRKTAAKETKDVSQADPFAPFKTWLTILAPALVGIVVELLRFTG